MVSRSRSRHHKESKATKDRRREAQGSSGHGRAARGGAEDGTGEDDFTRAISGHRENTGGCNRLARSR
jgi:hypothetical protein